MVSEHAVSAASAGQERFDICDDKGRPLGRTALRGDALAPGEYHIGAHIYVQHASGGFLLEQRAWTKAFLPGGWDIVMGGVLAGETSDEAARREVAEEIGLALAPRQLRRIAWIPWPQKRHAFAIYHARADFLLGSLVLQPDEVLAVRLVPPEEMLRHIDGMHYRPPAYRSAVKAALYR